MSILLSRRAEGRLYIWFSYKHLVEVGLLLFLYILQLKILLDIYFHIQLQMN